MTDTIALAVTFIILIYETRLCYHFLLIRKENVRQHGKDVTTCEGHRTIAILQSLPLMMLMPFISILTKELAIESGSSISPTILAAIPMSLGTLVSVCFALFANRFTRRNPKAYLMVDNVSKIVLMLIFLMNSSIRSYWILVVCYVLFSISTALGMMAMISFRFCGLNPNPKYRKVVFTKTETVISAAIGLALGGMIYDKWGYRTVIYWIFGILALNIILIILFVGSDINKKDSETTSGNRQAKPLASFLRQPTVLGFILLCIIPISLIGGISGYMFPLFAADQGVPVAFIGLMGMISKTVTLIFVPNILSHSFGKRFSTLFALCMGSYAISFLAFGYQPTILFFCCLLLIMSVAFPFFSAISDRFLIVTTKTVGMTPGNIAGLITALGTMGSVVSPFCLGSLMAVSPHATGLVFGGLFLICTFCVMLCFRKFKDTVQ